MEYRGYMIVNNAGFSLTKVKHKGAGVIPKALEGWYTSPKEAKLGVDTYLDSLKKGKVKNAKENSDTTN